MISESDYGLVVYLRQEGRGIGIFNKIRAYDLQANGFDTVDANIKLGFQPDDRKYSVATDILRALNITKLKLITNNPDKIQQVEDSGIFVVETIPCIITPTEHNAFYLETKKKRMNHKL